jgi:hypothetical protein
MPGFQENSRRPGKFQEKNSRKIPGLEFSWNSNINV